MDARLELVARLSDPLVTAYRSVAGDDHHPRLIPQLTIHGAHVEDDDDSSGDDVTGSAGVATAEAFRRALTSVRRKELDRGLTLVGPHRDDVLFELNGLPAKGYASHGESWSFALALKLASAELLRQESTTGDPVLILDDVFAELDQARRRMLATAVAGYEQVLITAAVFDDVGTEQRPGRRRLWRRPDRSQGRSRRSDPGMYIIDLLGALHHLVYEIVPQLVDEASGDADNIEATILADGAARVVDNGCGTARRDPHRQLMSRPLN